LVANERFISSILLKGIVFLSSLQYEGRALQVQVFGFYMQGIAAPKTNYTFIHDVAPNAVTMAVATDAMICTMNLNVSLFVMVLVS